MRAESGCIAGKGGNRQAGEELESGIEAADEEPGGDRKQAAGDGEFGDYPAGAGSEMAAEPRGEEVNFRRREAVEKEVGDHEVVALPRLEVAGVGAMEGDSISGFDPGGATGKQVQHGRAGVHNVGM